MSAEQVFASSRANAPATWRWMYRGPRENRDDHSPAEVLDSLCSPLGEYRELLLRRSASAARPWTRRVVFDAVVRLTQRDGYPHRLTAGHPGSAGITAPRSGQLIKTDNRIRLGLPARLTLSTSVPGIRSPCGHHRTSCHEIAVSVPASPARIPVHPRPCRRHDCHIRRRSSGARRVRRSPRTDRDAADGRACAACATADRP